MKVSAKNNIVNKSIQLLLLFLIVVNVGAGLVTPLMAVFVTESLVHGTLVTVGMATAIYAITKSFFQISIAKKIDARKGEKDDFIALVIGAIIGSVYFFSLIFITKTWHLNALSFFSGVGDAFLMAAYYAFFSHHVDPESSALEWSLFSVGGLTLSTAIGGFVGGFVAEYFGFSVLFFLAGTLSAIALLIMVLLFPKYLQYKK